MNIVLLHPEIPHNTGAIGRLCVGLDWPLHLIRPLGFALTENHLRRAGLDYWEHLDLRLHDTFDAFLEATTPANLHFFSTKATKVYTSVSYAPNDALVFGSESRGTPTEYHTRYEDRFVLIPMPGPHARSINLANSVAVAAYEAYRQCSMM